MSASKKQQPILPKSIPDAWTADTVTSTFVLEPLLPPVALRTDSCGFGWHFEIAVDREPSDTFNAKPYDWESSFVVSFCFTPPTGNASGIMRTGLRVGCTAAMMFNPTYTRTVTLGFCSPSVRAGNSVHDRIGTCSARLEGVQKVTFTFCVSFLDGSPLTAPQFPAALTERAKEALTRTIESGEFVDVKFYLFSAVTRDGTVCRPKPIYGSRTVLHQVCEYLDNLILGDGFSESQIVDLDGEWEVATSADNEYDYDEDSDLEELEEGETLVDPTSLANGSVDVQELKAPPRAVARRMGRICQPKNIAYKTFKGLLKYLYTQEITLAPLKSTRNAGKGKSTASDLSSAKSMYRLAQMIDLPALKQICLDALRQRLTDDNIYTELFSKFTWQHPDILHVELDFALEHWRESEPQRILSIAKCLSGEYPHGALAMNSLLTRLEPSSEGGRKSYSCAPSPHWSPPRGILAPSPEPWYPKSPRRPASPVTEPEPDVVTKLYFPREEKKEEYTVEASSSMSYGKPGKSGKKKRCI